MVGESKSAGHDLSTVEQKRALRRGPPKHFEFRAETIMSTVLGYNQVVSKLYVRETSLNDLDVKAKKVVASKELAGDREVQVCGKHGNLPQNCLQKRKSESSKREMRKCFIVIW